MSGSKIKLRLRHLIGAALLGISLPQLSAAASVDPEKVDHSREELPYRAALYHYFQGQHLQALTELEAGKQRDATETQADARLLEAGLRLGYGMHRSARGVLAQLLSSPLLSESGFASASFYLAQWLYLHQEFEQAKHILDGINAILPVAQQQQHAYLQQLLALKLGQTAEVTELQLQQSGPWQPYLLYNMAVSEAAQEQLEPAHGYLQLALAGLPEQAEYNTGWWQTLMFWDSWFGPGGYQMPAAEKAVLKDKILLAQASLYQRDKQYPEAVANYRRIRQQSPLANSALLGYGWSAYHLGDIKAALAAWQALSQDPALETGSLQSYLAIAWSHEQLGKTAAAENHYEFAAQQYQAFQLQLAQQLAKLTPDALSAALLRQYNRHGQQQRRKPEAGAALSQALPSELHGWVTGQEVQVLLQDLSDLTEISANLSQWQQDLSQFDAMLLTAKTAREQQLQQIVQAAPRQQYDDLLAGRQQLAKQIEKAGENDGLAAGHLYATEQEQDWLRRIDRVQQRAALLPADDPRRARAEARLKRVKGVLTWQQQELFAERHWQHRKALSQLDQALLATQQQLASLESATQKPRRFNHNQQRVVAAAARIEDKLQRTRALQQRVSEQLFLSAQRYLQRQQRLVSGHLSQAHLALTRLHEQAYQARQEQERAGSEATSASDDANTDLSASTTEGGAE